MDEIQKRLSETSEACIKSYEAWRGNQKDSTARENLMEAVHELRKVAARLEIEIAISERDEMAAKPIPIPPHRSSRKKFSENGNNGDDDNIGNAPDRSEGNNNNNNTGGGGGHQRRQHHHRRSGGGGGKSSD